MPQMSQEEALQRIVAEYPDFIPNAMEYVRAKWDLTELLSVLDSFY